MGVVVHVHGQGASLGGQLGGVQLLLESLDLFIGLSELLGLHESVVGHGFN